MNEKATLILKCAGCDARCEIRIRTAQGPETLEIGKEDNFFTSPMCAYLKFTITEYMPDEQEGDSCE